jgi:hypothetical protein
VAFPTSWDPYVTDTMTVLDVYHFGTQHLSVTNASSSCSSGQRNWAGQPAAAGLRALATADSAASTTR